MSVYQNDKQRRHKWCKQCNTIKPITEYYRGGANSYQSRCKPCHNKHSLKNQRARRLKYPKPKKERKKRMNGFQKLPKEKQEEIFKYYGTMPNRKLARRMGVNIHTFATWSRRGFIVKNDN